MIVVHQEWPLVEPGRHKNGDCVFPPFSLRSMSEQRSLEQNLIDIKPQASEEARENMGDNKGVGPSLVNGSVGVKDPLGYHRKREINRISPSQVQ